MPKPMGISFSQQISKDITNGYIEAINQLTANVTTVADQNTGSVNGVVIQICGPKACGDGPCTVAGVNINQTNNATQKLTVQSLQTVVANVKNNIQDITTQYVQSLNQTEQAWLSFAFGINVQDQTTINNFSEKISNLISNNVSTTCSSSIIQDNQATLILCGNITQPVNVTQRNDVLGAQSCISKQIINNIINNQELFNGMQFADQQNYDTSNGPFSFLYYIGLFILFVIIVVTIAGIIRYATREPRPPRPEPVRPVRRPPVASGPVGAPVVGPVGGAPMQARRPASRPVMRQAPTVTPVRRSSLGGQPITVQRSQIATLERRAGPTAREAETLIASRV